MIPTDFERSQYAFRGANDKRLHEPQLFVDTMDVGLFGKIQPDSVIDAPRERYLQNDDLWNDLLSGTLGHGDTVTLAKFQLIEWLPACPGRYFTAKAVREREVAQQFWDWTNGEYLPLGKSEMVLGGVGSVRLAPRTIRGGEVCFFCASSNGISHQGIPVVLPIDSSRELLREIKTRGSCYGSLTGTLWPLPIDQSPLAFERGIPKYYLFADHFLPEPSRPRAEPLVTVAITYSSTYEGKPIPVGDIQINPSKNWSFASFSPANGSAALNETVNWLKQYAVRHTSTYEDGGWKELPLSIIGDFDEVQQHFDNPIEFPLSSILAGKYDPRILDFYGHLFRITINKEIIMGDKFENIHNTTIINRSTVQDAIKTVQRSAGEDISKALSTVAEAVARSQNSAAGSLFNSFTAELNKTSPDKSVMRQCWDGLLRLLPDVAKLADASTKIATLFS